MSANEKRPDIEVTRLKKQYKLGQIGGGTLTHDLHSLWARVRGKEEPNTVIGTDQRLFGQTFMALNGVDLTVYQGEALGIIGRNGAGKSTLLKLLSRITAPTEGEIKIRGRVASMLEVGTGFHPEMTGRENVYLNGAILGMTRAEIDAKMDEIIEFSEVRDFIDTPVKRYSSGMFVRLAFAVAINIDPEILIVDEALSVGDVFFQAKCYKKFEEFKEQGKTIIFESHDLSSISKYCDRVVLLNKGDKMSEGAPKEMINLYKRVLLNQTVSGQDGKVLQENEEQGSTETKLWKSHYKINPGVDEYGTGEAEIIDFAIIDEHGSYTNCIEKGTSFAIKSKVLFNQEIQNPIFTLTFKNIQGTAVTGTNTMYEKVDVGTVHPGEVYVATFEQNMDMQGGEYLLSISCTGYADGNFKAYHRLYDVCVITDVSDKNTVGFYDMNSQVSVERIR